jgi:hypothetical protein
MVSANVRVLIVCAPSKAFGEIITLISLAKDLAQNGAQIWFLASPLAATLARQHFADTTFEMANTYEANQNIFWRIAKKIRPNVVVLAELYELLQPRRKPDCPFVNADWLRSLESLDAILIFVDFIAHVPALREIAVCDSCAALFGGGPLRSFLRRLWVILPCPLNEPGAVQERVGIPYHAESIFATTRSDKARLQTRSQYLSNPNHYLIFRSGSTWQTKLAESQGVYQHQYLGDLLAFYFADHKQPVTIVSVSDTQRLHSSGSSTVRFVNIDNPDPYEYERLMLASDLILTDNEISYGLKAAIGSIPVVVLVNSHCLDDLLAMCELPGPIWRTMLALERQHPGSIYPHCIYPLQFESAEANDRKANASRDMEISNINSMLPYTNRLGRMQSSQFFRAELYGGQATVDVFRRILMDAQVRDLWKKGELAYMDRLKATASGPEVLGALLDHEALSRHTVI